MSLISSLALVTIRSSIASPQGPLFTLYPFLDIDGNTSVPPSPPVPSEQPVAIDSHTPVMGFVPPGFSNGNQINYNKSVATPVKESRKADEGILNLNLKSLTRTKSTSGEERLESAGALALRGTAAGTVSPKADNDADERADMERISEGNSNEREIPETGERPRAVPQIPLYSGEALWMQLLVDRENVNSQREKTPIMGVGDENVKWQQQRKETISTSDIVVSKGRTDFETILQSGASAQLCPALLLSSPGDAACLSLDVSEWQCPFGSCSWKTLAALVRGESSSTQLVAELPMAMDMAACSQAARGASGDADGRRDGHTLRCQPCPPYLGGSEHWNDGSSKERLKKSTCLHRDLHRACPVHSVDGWDIDRGPESPTVKIQQIHREEQKTELIKKAAHHTNSLRLRTLQHGHQDYRSSNGSTCTCTVSFCTDESPWEKFALRSSSFVRLAAALYVSEKMERQDDGELPHAVGQEISEQECLGWYLPVVRLFWRLRLSKCHLSYLQIELPGKTSDSQECSSEEKQESCRVGARKPNSFHRHERQDTKPASSKTGQTLQKQKGKHRIYPSDILKLGQLDLWWGLGAPWAQIQSETQPLRLVQQHNTMTHRYVPGGSWCGVGVHRKEEKASFPAGYSLILFYTFEPAYGNCRVHLENVSPKMFAYLGLEVAQELKDALWHMVAKGAMAMAPQEQNIVFGLFNEDKPVPACSDWSPPSPAQEKKGSSATPAALCC
ncbi:hypothetical protein QYF61_007427 [Mycteria americana]|uniref:Uncharacterized protein n=1 Tax=Mycteria americana TaxID=33587 RepID=A0AAN7MTL5_MYCAM|nr:hypothetical protein QYF61_007427 [Mycteria americana]